MHRTLVIVALAGLAFGLVIVRRRDPAAPPIPADSAGVTTTNAPRDRAVEPEDTGVAIGGRTTADPAAEPDPWAGLGLVEPPDDVMPTARSATDWSDAARQHWAWRPLEPPTPPTPRRRSWVRTPIDAFVAADLEAAGLKPLERAASAALVRRLALAITGLPPTIATLDRFVADDDDAPGVDARLDALVDELLAAPDYGVHQARFWLDLVRYADTNGYEDDGPKPLAWQYRDFVIRASNDDLPYDAFLRMQLAGDLVPEPTADDFIAAGFLRLGAWDAEPGDPLAQRFDELDEVVSTTAVVCLGLSVGCARCHDHPDEPISTHDYFGMVAMMQGLSRPREGRLEAPAASATPARLSATEAIRTRQQALRRQAFAEPDDARAAALRAEAAALDDDAAVESAYRFVDTARSGRPLPALLRGDPRQLGEIVAASPPSVLLASAWPEAPHPRLALADWLVGARRALTARLIVNRVWAWHFGRGLTDTPANVGLSGGRPHHPALLDWLAHWFVTEGGWSLKRLHRLILTSSTFRVRCEDGTTPRLLQHHQGAFPLRRLRAEVIHDTLLALAGRLVAAPTGPPFDPQADDGEAPSRRAIAALVRRNEPWPLLRDFDLPSAAAGCVVRPETHTASQALRLWNDALVDRCAGDLAARIVRESAPDLDAQITHAFRLAFGRPPGADELVVCRALVPGGRAVTPGDESGLTALQDLALVLFNLNEFVFSP